MNSLFITILCFVCLFTILTLCSSLTTGIANMLTMCQAAFWGVGAYAGALMMDGFNSVIGLIAIPFLVMLVTGLSSLIVSYASIKLKGDSFVLFSLAFQMVVFNVIHSWESVTGGDGGLHIESSSGLLGRMIAANGNYWIVFLVVTLLSVVMYCLWQRSPYGRLLRAIELDTEFAEANGKNVNILKIRTFFLSAALSGLAGLMFAFWRRNLLPTQFDLSTSILVITALFLGGKKHWLGALLGATLVMVLPQVFIELSTSDNIENYRLVSILGNVEQMLYGLTLILMAFFRPQGLIDSQITPKQHRL